MDIEMGDVIGMWKRETEEKNRKCLFEAAMQGSIETLDALLEIDPLILDRVSLSSSPQIPLHAAALRGRVEFTTRILKHRPDLAAELDAERCSALHLAAANGHTKVVKVLLDACPDARLVRDREGRIPLHLAAMRGRVEVIKELISFSPADDSLQQGLQGDSALHLCVKYNHLDALKVLVDSLADDSEDKLLNSRDAHGNTILHLAVLLKQEETVRFLLSVPKVREGLASTSQLNNSIAPDVTHGSLGDFKSPAARISRDALTKAGANRSSSKIATPNPPNGYGGKLKQMLSCCDKWVGPLVNYPGNWLDETRGSLMTVATLIASITFNPVLSPPGGVWQADTKEGSICSKLSNNMTCLAGNAVAAYYDRAHYNEFMLCNTIAFMGSLSVLFLLISGFPPKNKFWLWLLTAIVCITVTFLGFSFMLAMILVAPDQTLHNLKPMIQGSVFSWSNLVGVLGIFNAVILIYLILKWSQRRSSAAKGKGKMGDYAGAVAA